MLDIKIAKFFICLKHVFDISIPSEKNTFYINESTFNVTDPGLTPANEFRNTGVHQPFPLHYVNNVLSS